MQREQKLKLIEETAGKIFSVVFVKKDKSVREMVCRTGVYKYTKGGENTLKEFPQYVTVFDMQKEAYKAINLDTLICLKIGGKEIKFEENNDE